MTLSSETSRTALYIGLLYGRFIGDRWGIAIGVSKGKSIFTPPDIYKSYEEIGTNYRLLVTMENNVITHNTTSVPLSVFYFVPVGNSLSLSPHIGINLASNYQEMQWNTASIRTVKSQVDTFAETTTGLTLNSKKYYDVELLAGIDLEYGIAPELGIGLSYRYLSSLKSERVLELEPNPLVAERSALWRAQDETLFQDFISESMLKEYKISRSILSVSLKWYF